MSGFDAAALTYDADFDSLLQTGRLRSIVRATALRFFRQGGSILELNCGTGSDAIALASQGLHILATDASETMTDIASEKISRAGLNSKIAVQRLSFSEIPSLKGRMFDGVFSNMGGLNCASDLRRISRDLSAIIHPGGIVVACLLSSVCLWETVSFALRGQFHESRRRTGRGPVTVSIGGGFVDVWFYSPATVKSSFRPEFVPVSLQGLNIFSPPPAYQRAYQILGKGARFLESLDDALSHIPIISSVGDHFVIVLRHTGD